MTRTKEYLRISVRRTEDVECLLEKIWTLRPELRGKVKLTVLLSIDALAREQQSLSGRTSLLANTETELEIGETLRNDPNEEADDNDEWE